MNTRTVDLKQYLPPFLLEFKELNAIMTTENPEFQGLADNNFKILDEMFITTATSAGISKFEEMLGINPDSSQTLEQRRNVVLTRWWDMSVYTIETLKERIIALQGNDNVQVYMDEDDPYTLNIITRLETQGQVENLAYIIDTMIPCNLKVVSMNYIAGETETGMYNVVGFSGTGTLFHTNDINETITIDGNGYIAMGQTNTEVLNDIVTTP